MQPPLICCIFNFAPHYRTEIYLRMENELGCAFYFGNETAAKIKKIDYSLFATFPEELKYTRLLGPLNWLNGAVPLLFKPFKKFILTGEPYCLSTWVVLFLSKVLRKKVFLWSHGWYGDESNAKRIVKKLFFSMADGIFLYGNHAKTLMLQNGFDSSKLHVIYNSLSYSQQIKVRATTARNDLFKQKFKNSNPTVLFIGRIGRKKKLSMLVDFLRQAKAKGEHYNMVVIGEGPDLDVIQAEANKQEVSNNIWFVGASYDENVNANLVYNADLCLSPGEVGLTGIHCLMYGTPVITHNNFPNQMPEFEAIQPGLTGDFFIEDDVNDLVSVVDRWMRANPVKTVDVSERCYAIVDKYYNPSYQINVLRNVLAP